MFHLKNILTIFIVISVGCEGALASDKTHVEKMLLIEEHMKKMGAEQHDVKDKIGQTLHQLPSKTFTCPTRALLTQSAQKFDGTNYLVYEKDGIYLVGIANPDRGLPSLPLPSDMEFRRTIVILDNQSKISKISCEYGTAEGTTYPKTISFDLRMHPPVKNAGMTNLSNSADEDKIEITTKENMSSATVIPHAYYTKDNNIFYKKYITNKNIEFDIKSK